MDSITDINLITLIQRTIELLAFYFILANLNGMDLKEALCRLFVTKQKKLYFNVLLLIIYLPAITIVYQRLPDYGYLIDLVVRPFVASFLIRRPLSLKKLLCCHLSLMLIGFVTGAASLIFSLYSSYLHAILLFLIILFVAMIVVHHNHFENIYVRLLKKEWLLNVVLILAFVLYLAPFFTESSPIILIGVLPALLLTIFFLRKERVDVIRKINVSRSPDLHELLKEISMGYIESDLVNQYTIKHYNSMQDIAPLLSKKLEIKKKLGYIEDYECNVEKRQIKINVIL